MSVTVVEFARGINASFQYRISFLLFDNGKEISCFVFSFAERFTGPGVDSDIFMETRE